jgi:hypothetical protein
MFISQAYADKVWPTHERRSAFNAAIQRRTEYILPVRFDQTVVPGLSQSVHYLSAGDFTPQALAQVLLRKIGRTT